MADILCYIFILSISENTLLLAAKKFIFKNSRYFTKLENSVFHPRLLGNL